MIIYRVEVGHNYPFRGRSEGEVRRGWLLADVGGFLLLALFSQQGDWRLDRSTGRKQNGFYHGVDSKEDILNHGQTRPAGEVPRFVAPRCTVSLRTKHLWRWSWNPPGATFRWFSVYCWRRQVKGGGGGSWLRSGSFGLSNNRSRGNSCAAAWWWRENIEHGHQENQAMPRQC